MAEVRVKLPKLWPRWLEHRAGIWVLGRPKWVCSKCGNYWTCGKKKGQGYAR